MEKKPDYKKMVSDELAKIEQKCFLLNDMLLAKKPHDRWDHDSALEVNAKKENVNSGVRREREE